MAAMLDSFDKGFSRIFVISKANVIQHDQNSIVFYS